MINMCRGASRILHRVYLLVLLLLLVVATECARVRHNSLGNNKQALKFLKGIGVRAGISAGGVDGGGLWPSVFNVATKALITVNATCGEGGREEFCRMNSHSEGSRGKCGVCDNFSRDPNKRHPINYAIYDGLTNRWWQSPALYYGPQNEYVTITLDLKQIYQVAYVAIKAANSPRPGSWILERSIDGMNFEAWQYFATSDKECLDRYGVVARKGKPHYFTDSEVICTSYHSKLMPLENGEIHTFLMHGRPGFNETSPELLEFTKARYVRLRLQGLRGNTEPLPAWLSQDVHRTKRLFYSIRDIQIGGQCVCNGHASNCRHNVASGNLECECGHHTCGPNCEKCCPLFNQLPWGAGTSRDAKICTACNCNGHAKSCHYDAQVDRQASSVDGQGNYRGGGVCDNCTKFTAGTNCQLCQEGYYRPMGTRADSEVPCLKCDCDPIGSTGSCSLLENTLICECKDGYGGLRCDMCTLGFRGYPYCEKCPCNPLGSRNYADCEGQCVCKSNVEGQFCDRCKPGYFSLQEENPEGCSACFCSGVTDVCASANLPLTLYNDTNNWLVCDISIKEIESPSPDDRGLLTVGNNEILGSEAYYWLAPDLYGGNKLDIYGGQLIFKVHWLVMRGDTSGKPTAGPNVILIGANGMRIASGDRSYTVSNMTFKILLAEYDGSWYHVPESVRDIVTRLRRTEYKGERVTRAQFLSVLTNLKHVLLRAKFHTDQIEASLEEALIYAGNFSEGYGAVEECSCPSGYAGLSCELCQYGYARVNTSSGQQGSCIKCNCNGHSASCEPCTCEHNTIGRNCERCAAGFYGNPLLGSSDDCKPCACPLLAPENNFSPSCQLDSRSQDPLGYVCTQCPNGYTGDHCEICDDGFFGEPTKLGERCEPCQCGGVPCNRTTGQCLGCRGNTEGWRCERCKAGFYGNPSSGCIPCLCDPAGSLTSNCNNVTGECECREHFVGRTCNKCDVGYGNVTAGCAECSCDPVGSKSNICDPYSGLCDCRSGVEGFRCDACQHLYYGFSENGCQSCKCNERGSVIRTCDIRSGECKCKAHYTGRSCDRCYEGYWEDPHRGCVECRCDAEGSAGRNCDNSGQCVCKAGVEGKKCSTCKHNYYNFSPNGCKECEVCNKKGHICDPDTGRCVCPPNSQGDGCNVCKSNTWGNEPNKGCKFCNCSQSGSLRQQCDLRTGTCVCKPGYTGYKCDQCDHGHYGYPDCIKCACNLAGTDKARGKCDFNGVCQCDKNGICPCKENVVGKRCNKCMESTFGLHAEKSSGCTPCFCFGRSKSCSSAGYTWNKIRARNRTLSVDFIDEYRSGRINSNDIIDFDNFEEIEGTNGDVRKVHDHFEIPLYWKLPKDFNGDLVLSYGGYLRFKTGTQHEGAERIFMEYPVARLEGNGIKLIHHINHKQQQPAEERGVAAPHEVRLLESHWKLAMANRHGDFITRNIFMTVLQNVSGVYIKATDFHKFENVSLSDVSLDRAVEVPNHPPPLATSVEKCDCPVEYNGTSCQNPSRGYYRLRDPYHWHQNGTLNVDNTIGKSVPCSCSNRSSICDIETGHCINCAENTGGKSCETCAEGFYGDPANGKCVSCACPSTGQNFAISCSPSPKNNRFICKCKKGYYGPTCDRCSPDYYGQPHLSGGSCRPCNCNKYGRINSECDQLTGQCNCRAGITGLKCNECVQSRHVLQNQHCIPCDNCTQILLDDLENIARNLSLNTLHLQNGTLQPPWESLSAIEDRYLDLSDGLEKYLEAKQKLKKLIDQDIMHIFERDVTLLEEILADLQIDTVLRNTQSISAGADALHRNALSVRKELKHLIKNLEGFGKSYVSTEDALNRGKAIFNHIKKLSLKLSDEKSADFLESCRELYERLEQLREKGLPDPQEMKARLSGFVVRLNDADRILKDVQLKNDIASDKNQNILEDLNGLKEKLRALEADDKLLRNELKTRKQTGQKSYDLLNDLEKNYEKLLNLKDDLNEASHDIEEKSKELDFNIEVMRRSKGEIIKHKFALQQNLTNFQNALQLTSKELNAVQASGRFKQIEQTVEAARKTIREAQDDFQKLSLSTLEPPQGDSIYDNTSIAIADSERLMTRVDRLKNQIPDLEERLSKLYSHVDDVKRLNWRNGLANNAQAEKINQMKSDNHSKAQAFKDIEAMIKTAVDHSDDMRKIYKEANNLNISMQYGPNKSLEKYLNLTSFESLRKLQSNIRLSKDLINNATSMGSKTNLDILKEKDMIIANFRAKKSAIEEKLEMLRAKIQNAEQMAASIQMPLTGADCQRKYRISNLEPSVVFNIRINFQSSDLNGNLFNLNTQDNKQYVKLNVIDGRALFEWKFLEKTYELESRINIEYSDVQINIQRDHNEVSMSVNNKTKELRMDEPVSLFNATSNHNFLTIGLDKQKDISGLPGCLMDVVFNDQQIGLWDFIESEKECFACHRTNAIKPVSKHKFNGEGYMITNQTKDMEPTQINIQFNMQTFDENSIPFMAYYKGTYMAIKITDGRISCEMRYSEKAHIEPLILQSRKTYNNGQEVSVNCAKHYENGKDHIVFEINKVSVLGTEGGTLAVRQVSKQHILKIKLSTIYFGGVPPDFPDGKFKNESFFGILSDITGNRLSLQDIRHFGVDFYPEHKLFTRQVLFESAGFLHLRDAKASNFDTISFILKVINAEQGQILKLSNYLDFFLKNGHLVAEYRNEHLESRDIIRENEYYLVEFNIKECLLSLNGLRQPSVTSCKSERRKHNFLGDVYLGSLNSSFLGFIKDIRLGNRIISINVDTYQESKNAKIGRILKSVPARKQISIEMKPIEDSMDVSMKDMQPLDCEKVTYDLEPNAIQFGDQADSYVQYDLKNSFWKSNSSIQFEFRTFYNEGLLFFAHGPKDHYNILFLKNGHLELHIKGKKIKKIPTMLKVDDGNWHQLSVEFQTMWQKGNKRKLKFRVDDEEISVKMPQNKVGNKLNFADAPRNVPNLPMAIVYNIQPFRGCLRSFRVNEVAQNLINNKHSKHNNVGQCFPNIEPGTYFRGDSYIVYDSYFKLNNFLDISFEFRTSEQNGILFSVSDFDNSPALSIEIQNGAVVLSVDMGNGIVTNVTNNLARNSICNNKWHQVNAIFSTELTIIVDGVTQSWVLSDISVLKQIEAPLHIGGLPDSAPGGTLKVRENFKGCLRNLIIDNKSIKWSSMEELHNVSLNSCPTSKYR